MHEPILDRTPVRYKTDSESVDNLFRTLLVVASWRKCTRTGSKLVPPWRMRKKSFGEILAEAKAANPSPRRTDFSNWQPQEEFRDQAGFELTLVGVVNPGHARQLVLDGAALASDDGCACPG